MKKIKDEKGAITMVTLITIIFMVSFLISSYVLVANKVKTQKEMLAETKSIYEPKLSMKEVYNSYFTNGDIIPIYTVEELLKIGSDENDTINGKLYTYSYSANYLLMNDLEFNATDEGLESDWLAPYENDDFKKAKGNFEWNGHTIKVTKLAGNTITYDGKYLVTIDTTKNQTVLNDAVKSNLVNYKIEGNSVQNGEPSPDTPVEIQSVGDLVTDENDDNYGRYRIPIKVIGKNKYFNSSDRDTTSNYGVNLRSYAGASDFTVKGTANRDGNLLGATGDKLEPGNYKIKLEGDNKLSSYYLQVSTDNSTWTNKLLQLQPNNVYSFTISELSYIRIGIAIKNNEEYNSNYKVLIKDADIDSNDMYEPYTETTYNIYLDEPLRKAGDSEDYIDYEQGKIKRQFVTYTFDGSDDENWKSTKQSETKTCFYISCPNNDEGWRKPNTSYSLSSHFKQNYTDATTVDNNDNEGFAVANTTNILYIGILNSNLDTLDIEGFRKWLSEQKSKGKPLTVIVKNERPDEFIDLPKIQLYRGINTITVGTEIAPSKMSITYNAKQ